MIMSVVWQDYERDKGLCATVSLSLSVCTWPDWRSDSKEQPDNVRNIIKLTMIMPPSYDCMAGCCTAVLLSCCPREGQDTLRIQLVIWVTVHPLPLLCFSSSSSCLSPSQSPSSAPSPFVPVTWDGSENSNVWVHLGHGNRAGQGKGNGGNSGVTGTLGTWGRHWWTAKRAHWSTALRLAQQVTKLASKFSYSTRPMSRRSGYWIELNARGSIACASVRPTAIWANRYPAIWYFTIALFIYT